MGLGKAAPLLVGLAIAPLQDSPSHATTPTTEASPHIELMDTWPEQPRDETPQEERHAVVPTGARLDEWFEELAKNRTSFEKPNGPGFPEPRGRKAIGSDPKGHHQGRVPPNHVPWYSR
ncbi:hypothetical protein HN748_02195 [Candidatus Peregrinibacteria bacterium]|jgi:hypothetical protein|nr:hypothetical protein [Candidatus Peregrinibacteria bacterium]